MVISYLDTSAAIKLLIAEPESEAMVAAFAGDADRDLVSSWLLHTELHCAAGRRVAAIDPARMQAILDQVKLIDLTRADLLSAGAQTPLRTQDAIHLAVAIRLSADEIITYDRELADAAIRVGIRVFAPGA